MISESFDSVLSFVSFLKVYLFMLLILQSLSLNNLKLHKRQAVKNIFIQEKNEYTG